MFRSLRAAFSMSRLPRKIESRYQLGEIRNIQKTRLRPALPSLKTVFIHGLIYYTAWVIFVEVATSPLKDLDVEDLDEDEDAEPADDTFIPFPGFAKLLKPVPYSGNDPVWKQFVKFSRDKKRMEQVRKDVSSLVLSIASSNPTLSARCGKDMKIRRSWLDFDFPFSPPPEYQRSGLLFSNRGVRWDTVNVDALTVHTIQSVLFPKAMVLSSWAFIVALVRDEIKRVGEMVGLDVGPPPPTMEEIIARHQQMMGKQQIPSEHGPPNQKSASIGSASGATDKASMGEAKSQQGVMIDSTIKQDQEYSSSLQGPIMAFRSMLAKTWKPVKGYPPKGSLIVTGLVEVDSPKAWMVFDVRAAYDPENRTIDPVSFFIALRMLQPKKQAPIVPALPSTPPIAGKGW